MAISFIKYKIVFWLLLLFVLMVGQNAFTQMHADHFLTPFENDSNYSATYEEVISFYEALAEASPLIAMQPFGMTDTGIPLHEIVLDLEGSDDPKAIHQSGKAILMINNAIHPGEPCGVDATMMLVRDIATDKSLQDVLNHISIVIIPFYNIGGGLNRGAQFRANQLGPKMHGFRGNRRNYDLNRDFIKCDTENARSFNRLFNKWQPHILIDNHTSNGADYQYTMTLVATQKDKLAQGPSTYMTNELLPQLYRYMQEAHWEMTPYVYARSTPDDGIYAFLDLPRFSSGYSTLHHTIGFMPETHMFKPFADRVMSTYHFMVAVLRIMNEDHRTIIRVKENALRAYASADSVDIKWRRDVSLYDTITFKGYEASKIRSEVTGMDRLYYDRTKPYEKEIRYYNTFAPALTIKKPRAYVLPAAYSQVIDRLKWNGVKFERLEKDTTVRCAFYVIRDFDTVDAAYEGHYLHSNVEVENRILDYPYLKGDIIIHTGQDADRYIVETLEPQSEDSFFAWNFFDNILMQKEYFSAYVFEDIAADLLQSDEVLRKAFEDKKASDPEFAENSRAQLDFIYKRSPYYEWTHRLYPVGRLYD